MAKRPPPKPPGSEGGQRRRAGSTQGAEGGQARTVRQQIEAAMPTRREMIEGSEGSDAGSEPTSEISGFSEEPTPGAREQVSTRAALAMVGGAPQGGTSTAAAGSTGGAPPRSTELPCWPCAKTTAITQTRPGDNGW